LNVGAAAPSFSVGAVLDLSVGAAALSFNTARAPGLDLSVSAAAPAFNVGAVMGLINGAAAPTFKSFEKEIKIFRNSIPENLNQVLGKLGNILLISFRAFVFFNAKRLKEWSSVFEMIGFLE